MTNAMASWGGFSEADLQRIKKSEVAGGDQPANTNGAKSKSKPSSLGQTSRRPAASASARARKSASQTTANRDHTAGKTEEADGRSAGLRNTPSPLSGATTNSSASTPEGPVPAAIPSPEEQNITPAADLRPCTEDEIHT